MKTFLRSNILGLVVLAFFSIAANAQTTSPADQIKEFDVNGMKVLIKRRPGTPTVAAGLFIRGGSRNITGANAGIENLMLDVSTEASKNFPSDVLRKALARTGSVISSGANYDYSAVSLVSTRQNFGLSWDIFTDVIINPSFAPGDVQRIKDKDLAALRSQTDTPEGLLDSQQEKILYAKHPYENSPDGSLLTLNKLTPADLAEYHKNMMQTSRLLLVIVGDVDADALKGKIADSFGKLPRGDYKTPALSPIDFSKPSLDITTRQLETNYVKGVFAAPSVGDPDYYPMQVAMAYLQQQIFQEVRVKRNLSYAPGADMSTMGANTGNISVSAVKANEAVQVMLGEIDELKKVPISEESIGEIANFFLTTYYLKQETSAAQAGELASYELNGGDWHKSLDFIDKIRQVKPDDVQRVANKYMINIRFVVVGNPASIDKKIFLPGTDTQIVPARITAE
jgi:zinc protease